MQSIGCLRKRERIYIVCFDKYIFDHESLRGFLSLIIAVEKMSSEDILEKQPDKKYMLSDKLWNYLVNYLTKHKKQKEMVLAMD